MICIGSDKPTIKLLIKHVRLNIASRWYDLGTQLLSSDQCKKLDTIELDHRNNVEMCCTKMLVFWLEVDATATWDKLIKALQCVGLDAVAETINQVVLKGTHLHMLHMYNQ